MSFVFPETIVERSVVEMYCASLAGGRIRQVTNQSESLY